jgi:hypothetical protein
MAKVRPRRSLHRCACSACQQHPHSGTARSHRDINRFVAILNEKQRRLFLGLLARQQGRGAIRRLVRISGVSRNTIRRGLRELGQRTTPGRIRRPGGGRPAVEKKGRSSSLPWTACCKTPSRATRSPA